VVVPAQCRDSVAALEPELLQRDCELLRAAHRLAVIRPVERLVRKTRDDLAVAVERLCATQDVRERQREVHHQAVHEPSSDSVYAGTVTPRTASATSSRSSDGREPKPSSQSALL